MEATLHVETQNRLLPSSACKIVHQNQLINFLSFCSCIMDFTIVSNATEICELFLTVLPYLYQIYEVFYVKLRPCPIGFVLLNGICNCDPVLLNNKFLHIKECEIYHITIKRPPNSWIASIISGNSTYSVCSSIYKILIYSVSLTGLVSSVHSVNIHLVWYLDHHGVYTVLIYTFSSVLVILFVGIALVVTIYLLNRTVTNGTITGIIFYANVTSINDTTFLTNDNIFKPLRVFISFLNCTWVLRHVSTMEWIQVVILKCSFSCFFLCTIAILIIVIHVCLDSCIFAHRLIFCYVFCFLCTVYTEILAGS